MKQTKYFIDTEFHEYKRKPLFSKEYDTIELISIGIVTDTGREYYAVSKDFDVDRAWNNEWLRDNVLTYIHEDLMRQISGPPQVRMELKAFCLKNLKNLIRLRGKSNDQISKEILQFVYDPTLETKNHWRGDNNSYYAALKNNIHDLKPRFYGYYCDYDHVVFCWLFGRMIDLPKGFPMYMIDLKQLMDQYNLGNEWKNNFVPTPKNAHNALVDAKWNRDLYLAIQNVLQQMKVSQ